MIRHLLSGVFLAVALHASAGDRYGLLHHRIDDPKLGPIDIHVVDTLLNERLPLLMFLDGSGHAAIYSTHIDPQGQALTYSSIPFDHRKQATRYHIAFLSKPGVALHDTVHTGTMQVPPADYTARLSAGWRTGAASLAIDLLLGTYPCDERKVGVMGFSEGAQVAPQVATANKRVTHVMAFGGSGLNQFFEMIMQQRMAADRGEITQAAAQHAVDSLFSVFADIHADPQSTERSWYGHSHLRWSSFTDPPTIDHLVQLDIPLYLVHGTIDRNTNVLSSDYVRLEFLRRGKRNLTMVDLPGCDHFLNCWTDGIANRPPDERRLPEAIADAFVWFDNH